MVCCFKNVESITGVNTLPFEGSPLVILETRKRFSDPFLVVSTHRLETVLPRDIETGIVNPWLEYMI